MQTEGQYAGSMCIRAREGPGPPKPYALTATLTPTSVPWFSRRQDGTTTQQHAGVMEDGYQLNSDSRVQDFVFRV